MFKRADEIKPGEFFYSFRCKDEVWLRIKGLDKHGRLHCVRIAPSYMDGGMSPPYNPKMEIVDVKFSPQEEPGTDKRLVYSDLKSGDKFTYGGLKYIKTNAGIGCEIKTGEVYGFLESDEVERIENED